jgi:hypothetical protein
LVTVDLICCSQHSTSINALPDSKTVNGVAEVHLTDIVIQAFRRQLEISGPSPYLFPSEDNPEEHQKAFETTWHATLRRAGVP